MFVKNNTLLIGKSLIIRKAFFHLFKNKKINNLSFRKSWKNLSIIKKYNYIIVSGFHFSICNMTKKELDNYIIKYSKYIYALSKKCKKVYLISTDINISHSFSRVVYFYYNLLKKVKRKPKIKILLLGFLYGDETNIFEKLKIIILKSANYKLINYKNLNKNIKKYNLKKNKKIKFYLINCPRPRFFDRLIRLCIDSILIKLIFKNFI